MLKAGLKKAIEKLPKNLVKGFNDIYPDILELVVDCIHKEDANNDIKGEKLELLTKIVSAFFLQSLLADIPIEYTIKLSQSLCHNLIEHMEKIDTINNFTLREEQRIKNVVGLLSVAISKILENIFPAGSDKKSALIGNMVQMLPFLFFSNFTDSPTELKGGAGFDVTLYDAMPQYLSFAPVIPFTDLTFSSASNSATRLLPIDLQQFSDLNFPNYTRFDFEHVNPIDGSREVTETTTTVDVGRFGGITKEEQSRPIADSSSGLLVVQPRNKNIAFVVTNGLLKLPDSDNAAMLENNSSEIINDYLGIVNQIRLKNPDLNLDLETQLTIIHLYLSFCGVDEKRVSITKRTKPANKEEQQKIDEFMKHRTPYAPLIEGAEEYKISVDGELLGILTSGDINSTNTLFDITSKLLPDSAALGGWGADPSNTFRYFGTNVNLRALVASNIAKMDMKAMATNVETPLMQQASALYDMFGSFQMAVKKLENVEYTTSRMTTPAQIYYTRGKKILYALENNSFSKEQVEHYADTLRELNDAAENIIKLANSGVTISVRKVIEPIGNLMKTAEQLITAYTKYPSLNTALSKIAVVRESPRDVVTKEDKIALLLVLASREVQENPAIPEYLKISTWTSEWNSQDNTLSEFLKEYQELTENKYFLESINRKTVNGNLDIFLLSEAIENIQKNGTVKFMDALKRLKQISIRAEQDVQTLPLPTDKFLATNSLPETYQKKVTTSNWITLLEHNPTQLFFVHNYTSTEYSTTELLFNNAFDSQVENDLILPSNIENMEEFQALVSNYLSQAEKEGKTISSLKEAVYIFYKDDLPGLAQKFGTTIDAMVYQISEMPGFAILFPNLKAHINTINWWGGHNTSSWWFKFMKTFWSFYFNHPLVSRMLWSGLITFAPLILKWTKLLRFIVNKKYGDEKTDEEKEKITEKLKNTLTVITGSTSILIQALISNKEMELHNQANLGWGALQAAYMVISGALGGVSNIGKYLKGVGLQQGLESVLGEQAANGDAITNQRQNIKTLEGEIKRIQRQPAGRERDERLRYARALLAENKDRLDEMLNTKTSLAAQAKKVEESIAANRRQIEETNTMMWNKVKQLKQVGANVLKNTKVAKPPDFSSISPKPGLLASFINSKLKPPKKEEVKKEEEPVPEPVTFESVHRVNPLILEGAQTSSTQKTKKKKKPLNKTSTTKKKMKTTKEQQQKKKGTKRKTSNRGETSKKKQRRS